jgi:hypothetical protein
MKKITKIFYIIIYSLLLIITLIDAFDRFALMFRSVGGYFASSFAVVFDIALIFISCFGIIKTIKSDKINFSLNILLTGISLYLFRILSEHIIYNIEMFNTIDTPNLIHLLLRSMAIIVLYIAVGLPFNKYKNYKLNFSIVSISVILISTIIEYKIYYPMIFGSVWGTSFLQLPFHYLLTLLFLTEIIFHFFLNEEVAATKKIEIIYNNVDTSNAIVNKIDVTEEILKYKKLLDENVITKEDFEEIKKKILKKL